MTKVQKFKKLFYYKLLLLRQVLIKGWAHLFGNLKRIQRPLPAPHPLHIHVYYVITIVVTVRAKLFHTLRHFRKIICSIQVCSNAITIAQSYYSLIVAMKKDINVI